MGDVNMVDTSGQTVAVPEGEVAGRRALGWTLETAQGAIGRIDKNVTAEKYGGAAGTAKSLYLGGARGVSGGLSDALISAAGGGEALRGYKEANPVVSALGEVGGTVGGALLGVGPAGLAAEAGASVSRAAGGRVAGAVAGGVVEGGIYGLGSGVSELALSDDPLTVERITSTLGSHVLLGAGTGGAVGLLGAGAGAALRRAKSAVDDVAAKAATGEVDDVAKRAFVDDVTAFRKQTIKDELFLPIKGHTERELKTIAKIHLEADKAIDRTLRNPKALASEPKRALAALQQQEHALEQILAKSDDLTAKFAADTSGARVAALEKIPAALERNRALQSQIGQLTAKPASGGAESLATNMLGGQVFGTVSSLVGAIPVVGAIPGVAQLAGSVASKFVTGGIGKALNSQAARMSSAIDTLLTVGAKAAPVAPVLATKTLSAVAFGSRDEAPKRSAPAPVKKQTKLADVYKQRTTELKSQTQFDVTGRAVMRPEARAKIYDQLGGVRAIAPILADRLETIAARRVEYMANALPRKPDVMATLMGADRWQPSDLQMRTFARVVAALEDPTGVVERLGSGSVTPAEAKAFREVYPEMFADVQARIMSKLPTLRKALPYQKRLALSIFSGIPVDPAMDPRILGVLQGAFESEAEPMVPQPQFGSVKNHESTPSQQRQEGTV